MKNIILIILVLFAVSLLFMGFHAMSRPRLDFSMLTGNVSGSIISSSKKDNVYYHGVEYKVGNALYNTTLASSKEIKIGESVTLHYDPSDPTKVVSSDIYNQTSSYTTGLISSIMACLIIIICVFIWYRSSNDSVQEA